MIITITEENNEYFFSTSNSDSEYFEDGSPEVLMMFLEMGLSTCLSFPEVTKLIITITGKKYKYFFSTFWVLKEDSEDGPEDGSEDGSGSISLPSLVAAGSGVSASFSFYSRDEPRRRQQSGLRVAPSYTFL